MTQTYRTRDEAIEAAKIMSESLAKQPGINQEARNLGALVARANRRYFVISTPYYMPSDASIVGRVLSGEYHSFTGK